MFYNFPGCGHSLEASQFQLLLEWWRCVRPCRSTPLPSSSCACAADPFVVMLAKTLLHRANHLPILEPRCSRRISRRRRSNSGLFSLPLVAPPATAATRRRSAAQVIQVPRAASSAPNDKKVANLFAKHRERIRIPDYAEGDGGSFPIGEFLRHPSGVESILNTRALHSFERLEPNTYRCTLPTIQFFKFEVAPVIDLRVISTNEDCIVEMLSCKFEGSETLKEQNHRFSASMKNHITWEVDSSDPYLDFDVNLSVSLEIYTKPFTLLPVSAVETPGNLIMQGLIDRLVPLLICQLLEDYRLWVEEKVGLSC